MIKFNDILLKLNNIIIFKLTRQLLKLIKKFKKIKILKNEKNTCVFYKFITNLTK